jgi:hypothetical protein
MMNKMDSTLSNQSTVKKEYSLDADMRLKILAEAKAECKTSAEIEAQRQAFIKKFGSDFCFK